ncbi:unnamed protein product [Notodromas monacha]|uniref:Malonyl-CoA:ACP transacylase (MAT) domain-containing protein n=1 Tax=Notodromas monacha TaxID=399045 RepID=A0A7R9BH40_9CRUS|nr:unnamed protein product [Notodromas monacha]CAG0914545.1 unnamed protein product [Notodromas monacha]
MRRFVSAFSKRRLVLLFPGQATQFVGMGLQSLRCADYGRTAEARFQEASSILGYDLQKMCVEGPASALDDAAHCQAAVFVCSFLNTERLRHSLLRAETNWGLDTTMAGFSVGEISALAAGGTITFIDAVKLVSARGQAMRLACQASHEPTENVFCLRVGLAVVSARRDEDLLNAMELINKNATENTKIHVAHEIFRGGKIFGGPLSVLKKMQAESGALKLKSVKFLQVAGAFHTPYMESATSVFAEAVALLDFNPDCPLVYSNVTGSPHDVANPEEIRRNLVLHLTKPVQWSMILKALIDTLSDEADVYDVGPGKSLGPLWKRNYTAKSTFTCTLTAPPVAKMPPSGKPCDAEEVRKKNQLCNPCTADDKEQTLDPPKTCRQILLEELEKPASVSKEKCPSIKCQFPASGKIPYCCVEPCEAMPKPKYDLMYSATIVAQGVENLSVTDKDTKNVDEVVKKYRKENETKEDKTVEETKCFDCTTKQLTRVIQRSTENEGKDSLEGEKAEAKNEKQAQIKNVEEEAKSLVCAPEPGKEEDLVLSCVLNKDGVYKCIQYVCKEKEKEESVCSEDEEDSFWKSPVGDPCAPPPCPVIKPPPCEALDASKTRPGEYCESPLSDFDCPLQPEFYTPSEKTPTPSESKCDNICCWDTLLRAKIDEPMVPCSPEGPKCPTCPAPEDTAARLLCSGSTGPGCWDSFLKEKINKDLGIDAEELLKPGPEVTVFPLSKDSDTVCCIITTDDEKDREDEDCGEAKSKQGENVG